MTMMMMVESKIKAESVGDVQAAVDRMLASLESAQPERIRYASLLKDDGETFVALVQLDDGVENPLPELPEYKELLAIVEGSRAEAPNVERWNPIGSYRMF